MATLNKVSDLGDYLREQRHGARLTLRQLADAAGVSNPYLSQVERGLRKPSAEMLGQIAKGLRISAETLYVRAGILAERGDRIEVQAAVLADPHLNERQRQVLLDIYETFRTENQRDGVPTSGATAPRKRSATKRTAPKTTRKTGAKKAPAPRNRAPRGGN